MTIEDGSIPRRRANGLQRSMTVLAVACLAGAAVLVAFALRSANAAEPVLWVEGAGPSETTQPSQPPSQQPSQPTQPPQSTGITTPTADVAPASTNAGPEVSPNDLEITVSDPSTPVGTTDPASTTLPGADTGASVDEAAAPPAEPVATAPEVPQDLTPLPPKQAPIGVTSSRSDFGNLPVIPVGKEDDGKLEVPGADEIGWYKYGASPGRPGATVLAAHVSWNGELGPFWELGKMQIGDVVDVTLEDGTVDQYRVDEVTMYPKDALPRERIWTETGPETLVLITCGGEFDDSINRYKHNIVVYAAPID